ncbi:MAG: hypothetical protein J7501_05840 [Bdellovibrio sp.]|nr:hypothetical protein [Bdellovibrio sp.]
MPKYLFLCLLTLTACGPLEPYYGSVTNSDSGNSSLGVDNPNSAQALSIINQRCTSCHGSTGGPGNVYNLLDVTHLVSSGLIVPGAPKQSFLFTEISSGSMPPGNPLSDSEQNTIQQWILAGNTPTPPAPTPTPAPSPTPKPSPSPSPSPSPTPTPPTDPAASFAYIEKTILGPKCTACHSGSRGSGGYTFDTYKGTMKAVNTKSPSSSKLYTITHSGEMPPSSSKRLNSTQENLILQWIQEGAKNN